MQAELPEFQHVDVESVDEAVAWLARYGERAKIIAGGTDLLGLMKDRITGPAMPMPELLVNIKGIADLHGVQYTPETGLRIGAAVTLRELEAHPAVRRSFTALAQAAGSVGTAQIQNMGTVGGNLCQRPWCSYFRHPEYECFKRGGRQCYAITGHNRYYFSFTRLGICVMAHPSDLAPALMALDATVVVAGSAGEERIPVGRFFRGPRDVQETVLAPGQLVVRVEVPAPAPGATSVFLKKRLRGTWDFALSEVAVAAVPNDGTWRDVRIALSGVAPAPFRATEAEELLEGRSISAATVARAADIAITRPRPLGMNAYKVRLTRTLVRRALTQVVGQSVTEPAPDDGRPAAIH